MQKIFYKSKYLEYQKKNIIPKYRIIKKKIIRVYVSTLIRTWETAVLLYLPFLTDKTLNLISVPTLVLVISPFLKDNKEIDHNDNLQENINQFYYFIILLNKIIKKHLNLSRNLSDINISKAIKKYPQKCNINLIIGNEEIYFYIDFDKEIIKFDQDKIIKKNINLIDYTDENAAYFSRLYNKINKDVLKKNYLLNKRIDIKLELPYSKISMIDNDFNSYDSIKNNKYPYDIFAFLKWVIEIKYHPNNLPIYFISHQKPMKKCLKEILNIFDKYLDNKFIEECNISIKTNIWSTQFNYYDYNVIGFRHAFSCGNLFKNLKLSNTKKKSQKKHTTLSLWGILSTIIFITNNTEKIFKNDDDYLHNFSIINGVSQPDKNDIDINNEITCDNLT